MFGYWNTCFRQHPVNEDLDIIDRTMFSYFCAMYLKETPQKSKQKLGRL